MYLSVTNRCLERAAYVQSMWGQMLPATQPWLRMSTHALLALTEHLQGLTLSGSIVLTLIIYFIFHQTAAVSVRAKDEPLESVRFPLLLVRWYMQMSTSCVMTGFPPCDKTLNDTHNACNCYNQTNFAYSSLKITLKKPQPWSTLA